MAGTTDKPLELFVGNAGTAARFLSAFVCLGNGVYRLHGVPRMHERPQAALFKALRELGYSVDSSNDKLPALIFGTGPHAGRCTVSIEESSQFASALLLCAKTGGWTVNIMGENSEESPYVAMTTKMIKSFPEGGGKFKIESDASSASYFLAASWILFAATAVLPNSDPAGGSESVLERSLISVPGSLSMLQVDSNFLEVTGMGHNLRMFNDPRGISRSWDLGDSIMTAIVLSAVMPLPRSKVDSNAPTCFVDLAPLRLQETERVVALRTELTKCGSKVIEEGDTLTVYPSELHGAEIETYNDHRMAMCFAILGLKVPGIKIKNPACVKKTFPNFFQKLAAAPPHGLGATILDAKTGRKLEETELFAD